MLLVIHRAPACPFLSPNFTLAPAHIAALLLLDIEAKVGTQNHTERGISQLLCLDKATARLQLLGIPATNALQATRTHLSFHSEQNTRNEVSLPLYICPMLQKLRKLHPYLCAGQQDLPR